MAQLDRVQNTCRVPVISARGHLTPCLVGCLPRLVLLTDSHLDRVQNIGPSSLTEFRIFTGYRLLVHEAVQLIAWSAAYPAYSPTLTGSHLGRVQNIGWPSLAEFKILTGYRLLVHGAVQLVAWSAAYPA